MRILSIQGQEELATVYVAKMREEERYLIEFAESVQPPVPREEKWVLIVSSLFGCPIRCNMCDAWGDYSGKLEAHEIIDQIDFMVIGRFPDRKVPIPKLKIQFARMGEPSLNPNILQVLKDLRDIYEAPGLMPCISTVGPSSSRHFFEELIEIKNELYDKGDFQLQFSIHSTNLIERNELIPIDKWQFEEISDYGERYWKEGDRKIALNFVLIEGYTAAPEIIKKYFSPDKFLIKLTPVNPTRRANKNGLVSAIDPDNPSIGEKIAQSFRVFGFETILSIGEVEENVIGSNCGMYVSRIKQYSERTIKLEEGLTFKP
jgi:23S rRNA (adenine2503-C2)-methyltransferase